MIIQQKMMSKQKIAVSAKNQLILEKYAVSAKFGKSAKIPGDVSSEICYISKNLTSQQK